MKQQAIAVRVAALQQMPLEVELHTLFGLQADDVFATGATERLLSGFVV